MKPASLDSQIARNATYFVFNRAQVDHHHLFTLLWRMSNLQLKRLSCLTWASGFKPMVACCLDSGKQVSQFEPFCYVWYPSEQDEQVVVVSLGTECASCCEVLQFEDKLVQVDILCYEKFYGNYSAIFVYMIMVDTNAFSTKCHIISDRIGTANWQF